MAPSQSPDTPTAADTPLDPEQARFMARVKLLMALSGVATLLGIAVVLGVVGYRVSKSGGSVSDAAATVVLPKGGRVLATAVAGDRIVVTVESGEGLEVRTFDAQTLKPAGRLRFAVEP
ncbi:hypothetical protein GJ689_19750 [Rhodoplanes serenus]|jgi:hypothetical protein|uniref:Fimbrial protein n=1 Tax=Rhodoplanes serenus TaxID=200615 RepID=A0A9X5AUI3_9BRAD|nr:hypothetical protein [Rhodoplanes serenus]MTW18439.1 hypothetical protein [Rhodoplanes serenus]